MEVIILIPLIITTARIFTTDADLSQSSLAEGTLSSALPPMKEEPWVFYQYHRSPGVRHSSPIPEDGGVLAQRLLAQQPFSLAGHSLAELLDREYVRTIPVVNAKSFRVFLERFRWWP